MRTESNRFGADAETSKGLYPGFASRLRQAWGHVWDYARAPGLGAAPKNVVHAATRFLCGCAAAVVVLYVLRHYCPPSASGEGCIHHTLMAVSPWLVGAIGGTIVLLMVMIPSRGETPSRPLRTIRREDVIRTSAAGWLKRLTHKHRERRSVEFMEDAGLGSDPDRGNLYDMGY